MEKKSETVLLMAGVLRMHRNLCEQLLSELGVHHSQHRMLMNLAKRSKAPSQKDIAAEFGVSPAAVAVTIKKLENGGYIARTSFEGDMRQNRIEISQKGRELVEKSHSFFHAVDERMFSGFDESELSQFLSFLERIRNNLTGEEKEK